LNKTKIKDKMESHKIPKFSVCIPTYNRANFLRSAIQSVIEQNFSNFELIIVDNCSTDNTRDVILEFDDSRIKFFVNDYNIGLVGNWNRCLELAMGEIIWILHSDDIMGFNVLSNAAHIFDSYEIGVLFGNSRTFSNETTLKSFSTTRKKVSKIYVWNSGKEAIEAIIKYGVTCSTVSIRNEVFLSLGVFDPQFCYSPDEEYYPRIAKNYPIAYTTDILAFRRLHKGHLMISTWRNEDFYSQYSSLYDRILQYALEAGIDSDETLSKISTRPKQAILSSIVPTLLRYGHCDLAKRYLSQYKCQTDSQNYLKYEYIGLKFLTYLPTSLMRIAMSLYKIMIYSLMLWKKVRGK
jgi:glycosyltransferase involved in cell wall biosynthesis